MTPKDKADELIYSFYRIIPLDKMTIDYNLAKQCALIAVDEILLVFYDDIRSMWLDELNYWHDVKKEIKNL